MTLTTYEVLALRYATRMTTKSECYLNYHLYGEDDAEQAMDYFVWLVRSPERTIVVDTGFSAAAGVRRSRTMLTEPAKGLRQLGADPGSVPQVVLTHAHYDHAGNLPQFPSSEIIMAAREYNFWKGPYARRFLFSSPTEREDLDCLSVASDEGRVTLVSDTQDVAPGVEAIEVGGHTPGQLIVRVATERGPVVLSSDAMHYYEEVDRDRPFAIVADLAAMYRGFDLLREMERDHGCILVAGHDPLVMDRFPPAPGCEGWAVRIA
ncbi:MAG: N-acyl homoserine lactonase family protein [Acidimicrobiaceae bacterium]|nr:N-acyl homoserine lactonase family protein [Acidimicrobiaceae bacterium]